MKPILRTVCITLVFFVAGLVIGTDYGKRLADRWWQAYCYGSAKSNSISILNPKEDLKFGPATAYTSEMTCAGVDCWKDDPQPKYVILMICESSKHGVVCQQMGYGSSRGEQ